MTKLELVAAVAERLDISKANAAEVVGLFFGMQGLIAGELKRGGSVNISGFGHFLTRRRAGRRGRNPRTGRPIRIRSSIVPTFRAGKNLKELLSKTRK
ncbi:MAG: HU family DNA-binding protein [Gemmatimonadota bacterium]|nr:HU family DNA-binding protein [Gemmatimonadota bacterium]